MWVDDNRAKILETLVKSQPWGEKAKTLANGTLQLLSDRKEFQQTMRKAILASEKGTCKDAIQDMLSILDPDDTLFKGWTDERIEALRSTL